MISTISWRQTCINCITSLGPTPFMMREEDPSFSMPTLYTKAVNYFSKYELVAKIVTS